MIKFIDMFSGIGGFREGLTRAGGFECVGHSEIDKYANRSYNALFDTKGEWFVEDARKANPETMPDFQLLCGGFPCQAYDSGRHPHPDRHSAMAIARCWNNYIAIRPSRGPYYR